jgi:hypothetical protein
MATLYCRIDTARRRILWCLRSKGCEKRHPESTTYGHDFDRAVIAVGSNRALRRSHSHPNSCHPSPQAEDLLLGFGFTPQKSLNLIERYGAAAPAPKLTRTPPWAVNGVPNVKLGVRAVSIARFSRFWNET